MPITPPLQAEPTGETNRPRHRGRRSGADGGHRRRIGAIVGGSVIAATAIVVALVWAGGDDAANGPSGEPLQLSTGPGEALASCLPFEVDILSTMSPAFAATVTARDGEAVTLQVDRWYTGDPGTDTIQLTASAGMEALIGGLELAVGDQYLLTATDGTVNYCGYSGLATPEMTDAFERAFSS